MKQSLSHEHVEINFLPKLLLGILCICLYTSCGDLFPSGKDDPIVVDAEIIRIDIEPNPVQVGNTVKLTCVLKENSVEDLLFIWGIPGMQSSIPTSVNEYSFVVDLAPGEYGISVSVDDTLQDGVSPNEFSQITVTR